MASPRLNLGQGALPEPARDAALRERERFRQQSVATTNKPEWVALGCDMDSWLERQWQQCCDEERPAGELQEKFLQQAKDVFDRVFPPIAGHETMTMPAERFYPRYLELEALAAAPSKAAMSPENAFWRLAAVCWLTLSHTLRIGMSAALLRSLLPMTGAMAASETLGISRDLARSGRLPQRQRWLSLASRPCSMPETMPHLPAGKPCWGPGGGSATR